jgi:hypothetical protein
MTDAGHGVSCCLVVLLATENITKFGPPRVWTGGRSRRSAPGMHVAVSLPSRTTEENRPAPPQS